ATVRNKTVPPPVCLEAGLRLLLCINPLVPYDASPAHGRGPRAIDKLAHGSLPLGLAQNFRGIIHSLMEGGMDRYRTPYPDADILLFEPDREDAVMFFASIFSY